MLRKRYRQVAHPNPNMTAIEHVSDKPTQSTQRITDKIGNQTQQMEGGRHQIEQETASAIDRYRRRHNRPPPRQLELRLVGRVRIVAGRTSGFAHEWYFRAVTRNYIKALVSCLG